MDSNLLYTYDQEGGHGPLLQVPLTTNFDECIVCAADVYCDETTGLYQPSTILGDNYSVSDRSILNQRDPGTVLDFLPMGDTVPGAYPGNFDQSVISPSATLEIKSPQALSPDLDGAEDKLWLQQFEQSFCDGYRCLPSPAKNNEARKCGGKGNNKTKRNSSSLRGKLAQNKEKRKKRPAAQLRTASRAPKRYCPATARRPPESQEDVEARAAHNQVERKYRNRLNQQFERLLAELPPKEDDNDEIKSKGIEIDSIEKRISKAEVLDLARRRIKMLEKQNNNLAIRLVKLQEKLTRLSWIFPVKKEE